MPRLAAVIGSVTPPGRLSKAVAWAAGAAAGAEVQLINLADYRLSFADGRALEQYGDDSAAVAAKVASADAVLLASPVYRATMTGALKNLLDLLPLEALRDKPVGIVAMGATAHHYLGVDSHLRAVLAWFGALAAPNSVYLTSADFQEGELSQQAKEDLQALVETLLEMHASLGGRSLGPPPLAARY